MEWPKCCIFNPKLTLHPHCPRAAQVNFQPGNLAYIDDMELELLQFHFHAPSEHAMDGKRYAMEVHLVHRNKATGELLQQQHTKYQGVLRSGSGVCFGGLKAVAGRC